MFDDYSDYSGGYDTAGMDALTQSLSGADGFDYSDLFGDSGGLGALSMSDSSFSVPSYEETGALVPEGSPNIGGTSDPEALKLLGQDTTESVAKPAGKSLWDQASGLVNDKNGNLDLTKLLKMSAGLMSVIKGISSPTQRNAKSATELQAELKAANPNNNWNSQQQQWANNFFNTPAGRPAAVAPTNRPSSILPGRGYAMGGRVDAGAALLQTLSPLIQRALMAPNPRTSHLVFAEGGDVPSPGALSLVEGPGSGQDDMVDASLSPGEYVFDADVVSALGDGSNEAGAAILDEWRQNLREHKRSAPPDEIPPQAMDPNAYLPGGR